MIDKQYGKYILACDFCFEEAHKKFDCFKDVVEYKKKKKWRTQKIKDEWTDVCPNCQRNIY
ncbi:hypothetical protein [Caloramator proteoclasticus]|uniref:Uncharacterized protein n=1 Tax=Caloramator proteoclasticus DSM 10124 TaxID=1121262 RepID=A0A1M4ZGK5_9CLOT|nr:hypothetical protein [Caloramator proteoclasticus]SHF16927.1 hypothetical protein SAMN02746091_01914 [Caloramator proteoclasticus DSM 10124]